MASESVIADIATLTLALSRWRERGVAIIALLATLPVWAGDRIIENRRSATIAVLPVALDALTETELGRLTFAAELSVSRSGRWQLKHLYDALDPEQAQQRAKLIDEAESAFKLGQKFYDELDARHALGEFDRAARSYEQVDLSGSAFAKLTAAWTMKIASLIASGEHKAGQPEIERLLAVAPEAQFSANFFPPDDIAYGESVRSRLAEGKVELSISSRVPSSIVFLDGRYLGRVPIELKVMNGEHFLAVQTPGFSLWQHRTSPTKVVCAPEGAAAAARWLNASKRIANSISTADRDSVAVEFARLVEADQVLLLVAKANSDNTITLSGIRLDAADSHLWAQGAKTFGLDVHLEERVDSWVNDLLAHDDRRDSPPLTGETWAKRNVGYIVLGSAAALLAGGIFFGIQAANENSTFRSLPQTDPNANALRSSGRTYAIAADLLFVGAFAAGVTGSYFTFFQRDDKSSAQVEHPSSPNSLPPAGERVGLQ